MLHRFYQVFLYSGDYFNMGPGSGKQNGKDNGHQHGAGL